MAYIGKKPSTQFGALAYYDTFTGDGSTTTFDVTEAMPNGGDNDVTVVVDNVRQEPGATKSYTIGADGNGDIKRVTFNVAPDDGSEIYVINPGRQSSILEVSDNTVSTAKLQATSVTTAKIAADAVTGAKIADDAVDSEHLVDGSVDNVHLANSSITINGTAVSLGGSVTAGTDWQAVVVADGSTQLTAVAGKGYFLDTNLGTIDVNLPTSPSRGDTIVLADYGNNFATNRVIVNTGGKLIDSVVGGEPGSSGFTIGTNGAVVELVFADDTAGWIIKQNSAPSDLGADEYAAYVTATGGTVTTSGDFKIHSFTGDGCFVVSCGGNPLGSDTVDYLVVAGGGGGGGAAEGGGGGGGAGGYRESSGAASGCYTRSPLGACVAALPVSGTTYPVTVGAGGIGAGNPATPNPNAAGTNGSNSVFSTITSAGGGFGGWGAYPYGPSCTGNNGANGGSGGGGQAYTCTAGGYCAGAGNTPPVSPPQGNAGANGVASNADAAAQNGGGGGGAGAAGSRASPTGDGGSPYTGGAGGAGATSCITGSPVARAGGGGGGRRSGPPSGTVGAAGSGGGGTGGSFGPSPGTTVNATAGSANTGGGGGGGGRSEVNPTSPTGGYGGAGGKGIVIIRYKYQN